MRNDLEQIEQDILGQQAAQWLYTLAEDETGQRAAFVKWLKKSPRHIEEFLLMSAVYKGAKGTGAADAGDIEHLIAAARHETPQNVVALSVTERGPADLAQPAPINRRSNGRVSRRPAARRMGLAAGIGVLALGAAFTATWMALRADSYTTTVGEQRTVRLADGSMVHMNARSRMNVKYTHGARDIELTGGEAVFQVAQAPGRPFRVHTPDATIQALGTQFNVQRRPGSATVVSVLEGIVRVSREDASSSGSPDGEAALQLTAGEKASVAARGPVVKHKEANLQNAVAWRERRLVFNKERLEDIAGEFAVYNPRHIVPADDAAREKRITGTFDADDPQSLVLFLEKLDEFSIERTPEAFIVRQR